MQFANTIAMDQRWFETIKKDYSDWRFAWAREAGQNSLDAGATVIMVTTKVNDDGNTEVIWSDNGCGMSRDTLINKFMAIGGSEKPDGGTGGFGVAKLILAFAQESYKIRTRDIEATGRGAGYNVKDGLPEYKGLTLSVVMKGDEVQYINGRIKRWVRFTTTKCKFVLNGEELTTLRMHKPKLVTDWCKVYTHKVDGHMSNRIRVRINQQYMFDIYTSVDAQITVDLNGTDSQQYLTSNRDGMNWTWRSKLEKLVEELYENPNAIKKVDEKVNLYSGTEGRVVLKRGDVRKAALSATRPKVGTGSANDPSMDGINPTQPKQSVLAPSLRGKTEYKAVEELIDGFDVVVVSTTSKTIPNKWIPGHMNGACAKLLNRWVRVLQTCGMILGRTEEFTPGWVFDSECRAQWRNHPEYGHMILLNPVQILETKFKNHWTNKVGSFYEMVAVAVHELTHIDQANHNNGFARDITYSMGKVMAQQALLEIVRKETA